MRPILLAASFLLPVLLSACGGSTASRQYGPPNMGGPTPEARKAAIAAEPAGSYYIGRRYFVEKTRFWGYIRKPGQPANRSQLVIMDESRKLNPDRLPEMGPPGQRYGFDQNYEYRIEGSFNGRKAYDPNSNQILPEFRATKFTVIDRNPGWLFSPQDHYDPYRFTLLP